MSTQTKAAPDTVAGGDSPDVVQTITKGLEEITKRFDDVPSRKDIEPLANDVNGLKQELKELKGSIKVGDPNLTKAPDFGWKSAGEFFKGVMDAAYGKVDEKLTVINKTIPQGMGVQSGPDGGYTIPPAFLTTIWNGAMAEVDTLYGRTTQFTIAGESLEIPANAETSRVTGSRYGGMQGYWLSEADTITASSPKFRKLRLEPQGLAVLVYATDKLVNWSPVNIEQYINKAATDEIGWLVGNSLVRGAGAGTPLGILNAPCVVSVAKESSQTAATIKGTNVLKMWARLLPRSRRNAVWFYNQDCLPQLLSMSLLTVGNTGTDSTGYFFRPAGGDSEFDTLLGRPAIPLEYCSTLGTVGDFFLADMSHYATGLKGGVQAATSMHVRFTTNELAYRFNFYLDGQPFLASAITPANGSNTQSPFITLQTR